MPFNLFKSKGMPSAEPKQKDCNHNHDWEGVDRFAAQEILRDLVDYNRQEGMFYHHFATFTYRKHKYFGRLEQALFKEVAVNRVCLTCGKCDNQVKRLRNRIITWLNAWADSKDEEQARAELAKKIWTDRRCDHE